MSEEDRLLKSLNKKSEEAFEKARRDALQKYQKTGGKAGEFHLAEKEKEKPKAHTQTHTQAAAVFDRSETPAWKEEHERREREEKLREAEENKKKQAAVASLSEDAHDDLSKWKQEQEIKEREFKKKLEDEERRKKEEIDRMKAQALREHQQREEEARREQALRMAAQPTPQQISPNQCTSCHKQLSDILDIFFVNDKKYCKACSTRALSDKPGGGPKCGHCKLSLESTFIKAAGRKYHTECFVCCECAQPIRGGFRPKGTGFVCGGCGGAFVN